MNFFTIGEKVVKGATEIYPQFRVVRSSDLMIRGGRFYAIWDEKRKIWSTDEYDVPRLVDEELQRYYEENKSRYIYGARICSLTNFSSKTYLDYRKFVSSTSDNYTSLDSKLIFDGQETKRSDYSSKHLPYALTPGPHEAYDELVSVLYSEQERRKFEWAIGSVIAGDSKKIQKFFVFYGEGGTGKSTILNIIQALFAGYYSIFDAKSLGMNSHQFATEVFKNNPLISIQHDGDLSKIEDNTVLNQIIAHEELVINEKNHALYSMKPCTLLFMGTNSPVKITNSKSGIIRRLIDIYPTGNKIPFKRYTELMSQIEFELPGIASHCLDVYREMGGKSAYNDYKPRGMIYETDFFYNFVEENYFNFKEADGVTLKVAYDLYKSFCDYNGAKRTLLRNEFCAELKSYFRKFQEITRVDGKQVRSWYSGFKTEKFNLEADNDIPAKAGKPPGETPDWLNLDAKESWFDLHYPDIPAQGVRIKDGAEIPAKSWDKVTSHLKDISTDKVHYCKPPDEMIVIDFDLKNEKGEKSRERNLEAASKWPPTYAEWSKGGAGLHLHYIYNGDPLKLSTVYGEDIEIKIFKPKDGDSVGGSLRRRLNGCNHLAIATISSGLPLREEKQMVDFNNIKNEKALRSRIKKNLQKEYEPHKTVTSIDYIYNDLERCYSQGMKYDVRDLRPDIVAFANNSSNNAEKCLRVVSRMHFASEETMAEDDRTNDIVFYDVEVFPNLFLVNWKRMGEGNQCVRMVNPKPSDIEELVKLRLIGFNCRRYDNHILWARMLGYTNEQLYMLSQRIISGSKNAFFGEAYNLSYTDVYDFCAKKQGLKKWEIELGIHHQELGLPWDEPVPEDKWMLVAEYCDNDVIATEAVFNANKADFEARQILAELSKKLVGFGTVNDTTNQLTTRIILRGDKEANRQFVYPDLSQRFPGYSFNPMGFPEDKYEEKFEKERKKTLHKSYYRGCDPSEGGRVYANPGYYTNVKTFDVASMHPSSIIAENGFGKYTKNFKDLLDIRLAIKHKEYDKAKKFFDGALAPYLSDAKAAKQLSFALKIAINSVYGLTSAKFDNALRDPRNIDNWVAKRGALFMIDLQKNVEAMGYTVVHVKTDSIKVANPTPEIENYILEFGKKYGYNFEIEAVYDRICLVNRAVYIARYSMEHPEEDERGKWTATGDQFKQPYIFKTLFSREPIQFEDMCETKTVQTALYLDMNENLPEGEHDYRFIGKAGLFCPVKEGEGGGLLLRDAGEGKFASAEGAKGYRWMEAEMVKLNHLEDRINREYYNRLVDEAKDDISAYVPFEEFVAENLFVPEEPERGPDDPPWDP